MLCTCVFAATPSASFSATLDDDEKAFLQKATSFTVLFDPAWAPLEYFDAMGNPAGLSKEYLDVLTSLTGLQFEVMQGLSWQNGYAQLLDQTIDMATSISASDFRRQTLLFTKPYITVPLVIIAQHQAGYIGSLAELDGRKIAVVNGYMAVEWVRRDYPGLELVGVDTVEEGLRMVQKGEVFCFVENLLVANHYLTRLGLTDAVKVAGNTEYVYELCIAVQQQYPRLVSILNKAIASIDPAVRAQMYERHLPMQYEKILSSTTVRWLVAITMFLVIILVFWIWTLVREIRAREYAEQQQDASQQRFKQLFSHSPMPLALIDFDGNILAVSDQWYQVFGFRDSQIKRVSAWFEQVYPDQQYRISVQNQWEGAIEKARTTASSLIPPLECTIRANNGVDYIMEISGTMFSDSILVTFFDITERKQVLDEMKQLHQQAEHSRRIVLSALEDQKLLHQSLMRSKATLDAAIHSMLDAVFIIDVQSRFILVNKAFLSYYRFASQAECPSDLAAFKDLFETYDGQGRRMDANRWSGFRALDGQSGSAEYSVYKKSSNERWVGSYRYAPIHDAEHTLLGAVVVCRDITDEKAYEQKLLFQRNHDFLTGLYSRVYFENALKQARTTVPLTLLIVDINGLKLVNDSFGHEMGDSVLRKTAQLMSQLCTNDALLARYGGDEFVFLMTENTAEAAELFIHRLEDAAKQVAIESFHLSLSYGYATRTSLAEDVQQVMKRAEDMMNRNKLYESSSAKNKSIGLVINSLFAKSNRESAHSKRVSSLCAFLAEQLGLPEREVNRMRVAGLMHDIGKIGVEEAILNKPEKLTTDEWEVMKRHPEIGYRILSASSEFSDLALAILEHHERWDGKGYPRGLRAEQISKQARIIMIVDSYDAMTSERSYKKPMSKEDALQEIKICSGTHYDPSIVEVFLASIHQFGGSV